MPLFRWIRSEALCFCLRSTHLVYKEGEISDITSHYLSYSCEAFGEAVSGGYRFDVIVGKVTGSPFRMVLQRLLSRKYFSDSVSAAAGIDHIYYVEVLTLQTNCSGNELYSIWLLEISLTRAYL